MEDNFVILDLIQFELLTLAVSTEMRSASGEAELEPENDHARWKMKFNREMNRERIPYNSYLIYCSTDNNILCVLSRKIYKIIERHPTLDIAHIQPGYMTHSWCMVDNPEAIMDGYRRLGGN